MKYLIAFRWSEFTYDEYAYCLDKNIIFSEESIDFLITDDIKKANKLSLIEAIFYMKNIFKQEPPERYTTFPHIKVYE